MFGGVKHVGRACLLLVAAAVAGGCSGPARSDGAGGSDAGGTTGSGGTTAGGGGHSGAGGTTGAGGVSGGAGGARVTGAGGAGNTGAGGATSSGGNSGAGGATGAGGSGIVTPPGLGSCVLPTGASLADLQAAYDRWNTDLVTTDGAKGFQRVRRPNSGNPVNSSNSEGTAYGMLIAVYMNQQSLFDNLWQYSQLFLDSSGLMNWEINPDGSGPTSEGTGAATDADEDMAFALVMADKTWGGRGSLSDTYLNLAKKQIGLIWSHEVDHSMGDVLTPGDQFSGGAIINISYFAPAYYRVFGQVTADTSDWNKVVESSYRALNASLSTANGNASNGLVPAWSTPAGVPMAPPGKPTNFQLDSCRTPFRIAEDYCWFAEPRALAYLQKISGFYAGVGVSHITDGYALNGTPQPNKNLELAAFVGPAGVGAMATPAYATLRSDAYTAVASLTLLGDSLYYNESWTVLSLLMMDGRFLNLTAN
jgi:endo-1,4-beta-D-glucanase Y